MDSTRFIFFDETAAKTNMTRLYGCAPGGERLVDSVPHGHWKTTTFVAGLSLDGIVAPAVFDGPIDGRSFLAYIEQIVVPCLRRGDVLLMDGNREDAERGIDPSRRPELLAGLGEGDRVAQRRLVLAPVEQVLRHRGGALQGEPAAPDAGPWRVGFATESSAESAAPAKNRASASEFSRNDPPRRAQAGARRGSKGASSARIIVGIVADGGAYGHRMAAKAPHLSTAFDVR